VTWGSVPGFRANEHCQGPSAYFFYLPISSTCYLLSIHPCLWLASGLLARVQTYARKKGKNEMNKQDEQLDTTTTGCS
jgi:hypothetical protein